VQFVDVRLDARPPALAEPCEPRFTHESTLIPTLPADAQLVDGRRPIEKPTEKAPTIERQAGGRRYF